MKFSIFSLIVIFFAMTSCTLDKTDYEAEINTVVPEYYDFKETVSFNSGSYKISIETLNGTFYKGYNELHLTVTNTLTGQYVNESEVTFLPILSQSDGNNVTGPHQYHLEYDTEHHYYTGYTVFVNESNVMANWRLYVSFTDNNQTYKADQAVTVQVQANRNLNMTTFTGSDGEQYCIALIAPQKPKVAENVLVAGIYKYHQPTTPGGTFPDPSQFTYTEVNAHTLKLDPRMPEPSMGNHSSPNNQDLIQRNDGLYYGVVNYTMTGNWTLNFILQNQSGQTIKGTQVSTAFTPGVEGAKSELFIDILF